MKRRFTRRGAFVGVVASAAALTLGRAPGAVAASTVHEVRINEFTFDPDRVQARVGDTIRWTNEDLAPHTATADDFDWDTGEIVQGETRELLVTDAMATSYFCAFHPHMKGTIDVV